jgi:hypothetical protein
MAEKIGPGSQLSRMTTAASLLLLRICGLIGMDEFFG